MTTASETVTPELGPYYEKAQHAGLLRRIVILAVDLALVYGVRSGVKFLLHGPAGEVLWLTFSFAYLVVLQRTALGTLGFVVTGVKIVTLRGERPSLARMTFRLLLWVLGPFNVFTDLIWLSGDDYKQTLSDKCSGTLVIRRTATPGGSGEIQLNRYLIMSYSFVFYEVRRPEAAA